MKQRFWASSFAAFVVALLPTSALAQEGQTTAPAGVVQSIRLYETIVQYPAPSWVTEGNPVEQSEIYRNQQGNSFIVEQIPKGEAFESWTSLYAITATYKPDFAFKQYVGGSVALFAQKCGRENFNVEVLNQNETSVLLFIMCASYVNADNEFGYSAAVGDVTAMRLDKVHDTFIKTYHHWRGPKFDLKDRETWPVPGKTVVNMLKRLAAMRIVYDPKAIPKTQE